MMVCLLMTSTGSALNWIIDATRVPLAPFGMQPIDSPRRTVPIGTAPIVPDGRNEVRELL